MRFPRQTTKTYWKVLGTLVLALGLYLAGASSVMGQCVRMKDPRNLNLPTFTPRKNFSCLTVSAPLNQTLFRIDFESNVTNFTINWGDNTPLQVVAGPVNTVSHVFPDTGSFTYTITQQTCTTVIRGKFINAVNNSTPGVGFVFPPAGTDNKRCLPTLISLRNLSPKMNDYTEFIVDWGGQEKKDTVDKSSYDKLVEHVYKPGSKICRTRMTVTYNNVCGAVAGQVPLTQSAGDYYFLERDSAIVTPAKIIICTPIQLNLVDGSILNCLDTSGRQLRWVSDSGWAAPLTVPGGGNWVTYNKTINKTLIIPASAFSPTPADSTYKVNLMIRNQCGADTASAKIFLAQPKTPVFSNVNNNICPGDVMTFRNDTQNNYPAGFISFLWDFGDGTPIVTSNAPVVEHTYAIGGSYTVRLTCRVVTTVTTQICTKFRTIVVNVRRNVTPLIGITPLPLCLPGEVVIRNTSVNTQSAVWKGWTLNNRPLWSAGAGVLPATLPGQDTSLVSIRGRSLTDSSVRVAFKRYGRYVLSLKAQSTGCPEYTTTDTIDILPRPTLRWRLSSRKVCVGVPLQIRDSSVIFALDSNGLPGATFRNLTWQLHMGDTSRIRSLAPVTRNFDSPGQSNRISSYIYKKPGIYKIALTVWVGKKVCPSTDTLVVQVLPNPAPSYTFTKNRCENQRVTFRNTTVDSASYYMYEVRRGNILAGQYRRDDRQPLDILLPYVPPGDSTFYQVTLKAFTLSGTDTCVSSSISRRVSVAPTPVAAMVASQTDGCSPMLGVRFTNASFNLASDTSNRFSWNFGNGQISSQENPPVQSYINNTLVLSKDTVVFRIIRKDGCVFTTSRDILIFPAPNIAIAAVDSVCSGVPVDLAATGNNIAQYTWTFTDFDQSTTYAATPSKTFTNYTNTAKTYTIDLLARTIYNCPQQVSRSIKIFAQPQVNINTTSTADNHCSPVQVRFSYQNLLGATIFKWYFGTADSVTFLADSAFTRSFSNSTAAPVNTPMRLVASNGGRCSTTVTRSVTINPEVRAKFSISDSVRCNPINLLAINQSSIGSDVLTWQVGGNTVQNQPTVRQVLNNPSNDRDTLITVKLIARNGLAPGCRDTATKQIRIHPKPRINGINVPATTGCSPFLAALRSSGIGVGFYRWSFGDGDTARNTQGVQNHTYENYNPTAIRSYLARVIGQNSAGCTDTATLTLSVKPFSQAGIVTIDTAGCSPYVARFSSAGSVNSDRFTWTFGGQQTTNTTNPNLTFVNSSDTVQVLPVRLIAEKQAVGGCPDTTYKTVRVYPKPLADFTTSAKIGCGPLPVTLTNTSRLAQSFYWIISSGGVSDTLRNRIQVDTVFSNPNLVNKTVQIDLVVTSANGCVNTKRDFATVYADVSAKFTLDTVGCSPHIITINNQSSNNGGTWLWNFGDGNTDNSRNPLHEFNYTNGAADTTYIVKLTSFSSVGGCQKTDSVRVRVHGRPINRFTITDPVSRRLQLPANIITIENNTAYHSQWRYQWLFMDGNNDTSRAKIFTHRYNFNNQDFTDTNFVITQIASNAFGCTDTLRIPIIIQPEPPIPNFTYSDSVGCSPLSIAFYNKSTYGREYLWDFGNRGISDERNPVHVFSKAGKYTIKLTVKGFGGVRSITKDTIIEVQPFGSALFNTNPLPGQEVIIPEQKVEFRPLFSCPSCTYLWTFGDGAVSTEMNPRHLYADTGWYDVSLTVSSANGCKSVDTVKNAVRTVYKRLISIPTAFVPSKAGSSGGYITRGEENKVFYPYTQGVIKLKMLIFNRWGALMYQSIEVGRGWDGYHNGAIAPSDTYVYKIEATFATGETKTVVGDVTLIH